MKKIEEKILKIFWNFFENLSRYKIEILYSVAIIAIIFASIGFYGTNGFDLEWFLCLHLPIYLFSAYALWKMAVIYKRINRKINNK